MSFTRHFMNAIRMPRCALIRPGTKCVWDKEVDPDTGEEGILGWGAEGGDDGCAMTEACPPFEIRSEVLCETKSEEEADKAVREWMAFHLQRTNPKVAEERDESLRLEGIKFEAEWKRTHPESYGINESIDDSPRLPKNR